MIYLSDDEQQALGVMVLRVSTDEIISSVDPISAAMFGYTAEEMTGQKLEILIPEFDRSRQSKRFRAAAREEAFPAYMKVVTALRKDGTMFTLRHNVSRLSDNSGDNYFIAIMAKVLSDE